MKACAAGSAAEALARAAEHAFDAVLSDVQMPGGDGHQLLAALRARHPDVPLSPRRCERPGRAARRLRQRQRCHLAQTRMRLEDRLPAEPQIRIFLGLAALLLVR
jgi:hypothetical protein